MRQDPAAEANVADDPNIPVRGRKELIWISGAQFCAISGYYGDQISITFWEHIAKAAPQAG
jgi:hypothetical protein